MLINLLSFTVNVEYVLRIRYREFHSFDEIFIEALKKNCHEQNYNNI